jgi:hypothetical protein
MKKLVKMILVAIPALVLAAAVGMTTSGCGDDTTSPVPDLASPTTGNDMAKAVGDMAQAGGTD